VQNIKLLITQYLPSALHFLPLMYELSPQHPVLCHPRSIFLLHCEKPIFTITQNKNKIITVYVLIFLFWFLDIVMEECQYIRFVISEGQRQNKNSKRFWRRCAINWYVWSLWTQSIRSCWF